MCERSRFADYSCCSCSSCLLLLLLPAVHFCCCPRRAQVSQMSADEAGGAWDQTTDSEWVPREQYVKLQKKLEAAKVCWGLVWGGGAGVGSRVVPVTFIWGGA